MAFFEITTVYADGPDDDRRIDAVAGPGFHHTIDQAVRNILSGGARYGVKLNGRIVNVKAHYRPLRSRWHLATEPDAILLNNLSYLSAR